AEQETRNRVARIGNSGQRRLESVELEPAHRAPRIDPIGFHPPIVAAELQIMAASHPAQAFAKLKGVISLQHPRVTVLISKTREPGGDELNARELVVR